MKNSIAFRAELLCGISSPWISQRHTMSRTIQEWPLNPKKLRNLGFQAFSVIPLLRGNSDALNQSNL